MSSLVKLAPLAVALVVFAVVVAFLLQTNAQLGTWLLAAFLLGHGLVHVMFVVPSPAPAGEAGGMEYPFDAGKSWLIGDVLAAQSVRLLVTGLVAVVVVGYGLAALATVEILIPSTWWPLLVIVATVSSVALLLIALSPGLLLGFAIDLVLLWLAIVATWSPELIFGG